MRYQVTIIGISPLIQHSAAGLDPKLPANIEKAEIARKKGSNRTEQDDARLRQLETLTSLWLDEDDQATIPPHALRACIEQAARKLKQGPQVREGLIVTRTITFAYDDERLGATAGALSNNAQFTVPVVVGRSRILRTRAKFDDWSAVFEIEVDEELVDQQQLETWLDIAGRRIGLGDWRPTKSGHYGRFEASVVEES